MRLRFITILVLSWLFVTNLSAQKNDEEKRRADFVKDLEQKRNILNKDSGDKNKPLLANNAKPITNTAPPDDEETIKVETRLVRLDVLVYDQNGNTVLGLKADDFI